jgi:prevent-host-death family protein
MDVSIADAESRLPQLIAAVKAGERVVITRDGKPVAELAPAPRAPRQPKFDTMKGRVHLKPGWNDPVDEDQFLSGDF